MGLAPVNAVVLGMIMPRVDRVGQDIDGPLLRNAALFVAGKVSKKRVTSAWVEKRFDAYP